MEQGTLQLARAITPAIILMVLLGPVQPHLPTLFLLSNLPVKFVEVPIYAAIFGLVYAGFSLRSASNEAYHKRVRSNIDEKLWEMARPGLPRAAAWTFPIAREIFYHFIDNDKTLTAKSRLVYFNGYIWTTVADIRAVSLFVALFIAGFGLGAGFSRDVAVDFWLCVFAFLVSFPLSERVTKKHIELANEQFDYIFVHLKLELIQKMEALGL